MAYILFFLYKGPSMLLVNLERLWGMLFRFTIAILPFPNSTLKKFSELEIASLVEELNYYKKDNEK